MVAGSKKKKKEKHYLQETKAFVYSKTDKADHGIKREEFKFTDKFGPGYGGDGEKDDARCEHEKREKEYEIKV